MPARGSYRFFLANEGLATARKINVELDGKPMVEHQLILKAEDPVTTLGAGRRPNTILRSRWDLRG